MPPSKKPETDATLKPFEALPVAEKTEGGDTKVAMKPAVVSESKAAQPKAPGFTGAVPPGKGGVYRIVNGKRVKINR